MFQEKADVWLLYYFDFRDLAQDNGLHKKCSAQNRGLERENIQYLIFSDT